MINVSQYYIIYVDTNYIIQLAQIVKFFKKIFMNLKDFLKFLQYGTFCINCINCILYYFRVVLQTISQYTCRTAQMKFRTYVPVSSGNLK